MGADHYLFARAALDPVFVHNPLFFQHGQDLPVVDKRSERADVLTLFTMLNGVHRNFDCAPDPFAKAGCPGDDDFHDFPIFKLLHFLHVLPTAVTRNHEKTRSHNG